MTSKIQKINISIHNKRNRQQEILGAIKTLKIFQNDLGSQDVLDAIQVLIKANKKLKGQIDYSKKKVNKLYEQPGS